ncbi:MULTISPECIES: 2-oxoacid:acceptor oxidoreductase family protein [Sedimentibacter]|uniref:2-oxoacid:acceptor oxidoreductase family protein n=1 Tax=Sedimentibacter hydroxybenzoicus DSM 7310 TaxID=1123245 RepID=A0A974GXQ3_SEDHY|nr:MULTISPECIES: 2-oxoacid:acceptor oxidoreductase family protein [Sedimentibacter]NYB75847.1 2-oxoacid:acceptor oxidoreductase family protein [Sedimentibacter hydroxybenzoicus DSM 7310]HCX60805.1 pyruvate ferredoxin oxidoreductase [Clostridiales bacterium]
MISIKFYGLGGQGVVTAGKIFSEAISLYEDKYAITVPAYGHERRGAPVNTSIIVDEKPVLINSFVYHPDIVLVMDSTIIDKDIDISQGIHENSILVLNTEDVNVVNTYKKYNFKEIYYVDGTQIALNNIGRGIPNGSMLGAIAGTGLLTIESIEKAIIESFGEKAGEKNAKAAREAFERVKKM